jgi:hypothetical protein
MRLLHVWHLRGEPDHCLQTRGLIGRTSGCGRHALFPSFLRSCVVSGQPLEAAEDEW